MLDEASMLDSIQTPSLLKQVKRDISYRLLRHEAMTTASAIGASHFGTYLDTLLSGMYISSRYMAFRELLYSSGVTTKFHLIHRINVRSREFISFKCTPDIFA